MTYPRWSRAELDYLESMAGDVPFPELLRLMQQHAVEQGWPARSANAIAMRMKASGHCRRIMCSELTTGGGVAELLGCKSHRVYSMLRNRRIQAILKPHWVGPIRYIKRAAWRRLAVEYPRALGGFSADQLYALLEDRDLAESVAARYPYPFGERRIRCVETGRVYANCGEAARIHHVAHSSISLAIRKGRPVSSLGMTFEALRCPAG